MNEEYDYRFTIRLIGDRSVGKSSLVQRFVSDSFAEDAAAVHKEERSVRLLHDGDKTIKLEIVVFKLEQHGRYSRHYNPYSPFTAAQRIAHGIAVVCDVTNIDSVNNVKHYLAEMERYASSSTNRLIVANKCDYYGARVVSSADLKRIADQCDGVPLIETSAKDNVNVELLFTTLALAIKDRMTAPVAASHPVALPLPPRQDERRCELL